MLRAVPFVGAPVELLIEPVIVAKSVPVAPLSDTEIVRVTLFVAPWLRLMAFLISTSARDVAEFRRMPTVEPAAKNPPEPQVRAVGAEVPPIATVSFS